VTIGIPQHDANKWTSRLSISGLEKDISVNASGIDGMQALINALVGARRYLNESGHTFEYAGGVPGHGFPRMLIDATGDGFLERLEAIIDAEELRHLAELKERHHAAG
jgi:hypothetical protein